jgi:hypothetical protein
MVAHAIVAAVSVLRAVPAALVLALPAALVCCSAASTTNVNQYQGNYTLTLVDGANTCALAGLAEGQSQTSIPLSVVQNQFTPQDMEVTLGGSAGTLMASLVGTSVLVGTLGGSQVTLTPGPIDGSTPMGAKGMCTFQTSVSVSLNFGGDTVQGTIVYSDVTNGASECGLLRNCQTTLAIAGVLVSSDAGGGSEGGGRDSGDAGRDAGDG